MSDADLNIGVYGDSSGAVQALDALTEAQGNYQESLTGLGAAAATSSSAMSNAFEHSGIHLMNHELLSMVGLGGQSRATMGLMSAGVSSLAASFGVAMETLAPWLLAIGAGILLWEKFGKSGDAAAAGVEEARKKIDETTASLAEFYQGQEKVSAAGKEVAAVAMGNLGEQIRKTQDDIRGFNAELDGSAQKFRENESSIGATGEMVYAFKELWKMLPGVEEAAAEKATAGQVETRKQLANSVAELKKLQGEYAKMGALAGGASDAGAKGAEKAAEANKKFAESMAAISKESARAARSFDEFMGKDSVQTGKVASAKDDTVDREQQKYAEMKAAAEEYYGDEVNRINASAEDFDVKQEQIVQVARAANARITAIDKQRADDAKGQLNGVEQAFANTYQSATNQVGAAMAQMIVYHKSWHDSFINFSKDLESQFVQMVAVMLEKWLLFTALTGGLGLSSGFASAFTGFKPAATGFSGLVDSPTAFLAGEGGGVEHVSITPLAGGGTGAGQGSGGGQNVGINVTVNAAGVVTDLRSFASQVGQQLAQQIRGGGQLNLTRTA